MRKILSWDFHSTRDLGDFLLCDVELPAFLTAKNLKPFIDDDLKVTSS